MFNPDEELGSPGSRSFLRQAAARHDFGLVFEPSLPDGALASHRKGSGTYHLAVKGLAAHAGRDPATFPISKRVYLAVDDNAKRAEERLRRCAGRDSR